MPFGVDDFFARPRIDFADLGDLAAFHRDIRIEPRIAAAVDDLAVDDDDIVKDAASARTIGGGRDLKQKERSTSKTKFPP